MAANVGVAEACPRTHPIRCPPHQTSGMSALRNAVLHASVDVVDALLAAGMDPNEEVGAIPARRACMYAVARVTSTIVAPLSPLTHPSTSDVYSPLAANPPCCTRPWPSPPFHWSILCSPTGPPSTLGCVGVGCWLASTPCCVREVHTCTLQCSQSMLGPCSGWLFPRPLSGWVLGGRCCRFSPYLPFLID